MPLGDEKHKLIYEELVNILGLDYVEDDPAVMEAFSRDHGMPTVQKERVEFIVLPGSTEDVQQIVRLANRYQFPYSITSTGLTMQTCIPVKGYPYWCFIDPKRMNHLEIDEDNMYAIVEPYVTAAQLLAESMKRGLYTGTPGASGQSSVLANNIHTAIQWTSWRTGIGRNVLGVEWVLPNGDVLRTGSLATPGAGYCWGEGPGPDARGLLRGQICHLGSLGVVTRIATALYPWPGPRVFPTEGVQPEKKSVLPSERFKTYFFSFPTLEKAVEAVREMGKAEIAGCLLKFAPFDFLVWSIRSREEWWKAWESEYWTKQKESGHMIAVSLWGFTSEKQVKYEEKVLKQIVEELGGESVPDEVHQLLDASLTPNFARDTHRCGFMRIGGYPTAIDMSGDSLEDVLRSTPMALRIKDKYTPPLGYVGRQQKFWPFDFGHNAITEVDVLSEKSTERAKLMKEGLMPEMMERILEDGTPNLLAINLPMNQIGHLFCNVHLLFGKIKKALDPNNVANPTRIIDMEAMEKGDIKV